MRYDLSEEGRFGLAFGGIVPIAVGGLLVGVRSSVDSANIALVLVLVVIVSATIGGRASGAVAALSSALSFDFFHTVPYQSLSIDSSDDVETTVLLLVIGLVIGQIVSSQRRRTAEIATGHDEVAGLHRTAELAASSADVTAVAAAVTKEVTAVLVLEDCSFAADAPGEMAVMERSGRVDAPYVFTGDGFHLPAAGVAIEVRGGGRTGGWLLCRPRPGVGVGPDRRRTAIALADHLGLAIAARSATES